MKQIPSIFLEDNEFEELKEFKTKNNLTWKEVLLFPIKHKEGKNEQDST